MKTANYFIALMAMIIITSCSPLRVSSDYDEAVDFTQYKTFSFHDKGIEKLQLNDLDKRRVINAVTTELTAKGMQPAKDQPDVVVNILASNKEKIDVNYYNDPFWGWYYYPWGMNQASVNQYTEGTLIIDLIDNKTNTLVWQGQGSGFRVDNIQNKAETIKEAINIIMSHYPPGSEKK
ncbi:MAG: DUF4136 domain-containing protein [Flavobacteriales bacterium]